MYKILITLLVMSGLTMAGDTKVTVNPQVNKFKNSFGQNCYRSGQLKADDDKWWQSDRKAFPTENEDMDQSDASTWTSLTDCEYEIKWDKPSKNFKRFIAQMTKRQESSITYDSVTHVMSISFDYDDKKFTKEFHNGSYNMMSDSMVVKKVRLSSRSVLSDFRGRIEDNGVNICRAYGKLYSVDLTFRRIFRHGLVPLDVSYIMASYDVSGEIKKIDIKWPSFKKIPEYGPTIGLQESVDLAVSSYSEVTAAEKGDSVIACHGANIKGVATAWKRLVTEDGGNYLSPCYTFKAVMIMADKDSVVYPIDIPRLKKYN